MGLACVAHSQQRKYNYFRDLPFPHFQNTTRYRCTTFILSSITHLANFPKISRSLMSQCLLHDPSGVNNADANYNLGQPSCHLPSDLMRLISLHGTDNYSRRDQPSGDSQSSQVFSPRALPVQKLRTLPRRKGLGSPSHTATI